MLVESALSGLFKREPVKTEYWAGRYLSDMPISFSSKLLRYLDAPWSVIINEDYNPDYVLKYTGGYVGKVIVVCQHIKWKALIPYWKTLGVTHIFTPHADCDYIDYIKVCGFPHLAQQEYTKEKGNNDDIDLSFQGAKYTHWSRAFVLDNWQSWGNLNWHIQDTGKWHFEKNGEDKENSAKTFKNILSASKFALCPRGTGPGTIRFYEALSFGAIPVVIADNWVPPKVRGVDWDNTIVRVPESKGDIAKLPEILGNFGQKDVQSMRDNCIDAYAALSGKNLIKPILDYFGVEQ